MAVLRIKEFRKQNKLSRIELSIILGVAQNTVAQWETGVRSPSIAKLCELSELFGCTLDELVDKAETLRQTKERN